MNKFDSHSRRHSDIQRYIAVTTVGPSTLRNQGKSGVIEMAQSFLSEFDLHRLTVNDERAFLRVLDTMTEELRQQLPRGAQHWGAARKAVNLFLRDCCYNRIVSDTYRLASLEAWLEIPLDSVVAAELKRRLPRRTLPAWPRLKGLTPPVSAAFQRVAKARADADGITRPRLDMRLWVAQRKPRG